MKCLKTLTCSDSVAVGIDLKWSTNKQPPIQTHTHTLLRKSMSGENTPQALSDICREASYTVDLISISTRTFS